MSTDLYQALTVTPEEGAPPGQSGEKGVNPDFPSNCLILLY